VNWTVLHYITDTIEYEWFTVDCTVGGGMWRGCNLQDLRARLEARPGGCKHLGARQATLASCTSGCSHLTLGLPSLRCLGYLPVCWVEQAYMCHLSSCLNAEHTLRAHDAWATLGMTQTCAPLGDTWRLSHAAGLKANGSGVKTQLLLGPPSRPKVPGS